MMTLESQLAEYGQLQDEVFGPISLDEVATTPLVVEGPVGWAQGFRKNPVTLAIAAMVAVILVIGGIAFLMGGNEADPVDIPTTVPLPGALRQEGEVITHIGDPRAGGDLLAQYPDTGEVWTLVSAETLGGSLVGRAAWSADGMWAAYEILACGGGGAIKAGTGGLWVTNGVDEPRQVTSPCTEEGSTNDVFTEFWEWSPAGAQLVVARQFNDGDALILIDPATGDRTDLGKMAGDVTSLSWSPDGTQIAYAVVSTGSPDGISEEASVHSVSVDGGVHSLLASSLGGRVPGGEEGSGLRWSPDGTRIAVLAAADENRLYLMDADGSNLELVTEGVVIEHVLGSPNLVWSSDGTAMAYATFSGGRAELEVWNGSPDGSPPILVFDSPSVPGDGFWFAGGPVWSPDGRSIAFRYAPTDDQNAWMVANADGTGDVHEIDELQYLSWRGGWYFCECFG
jgi:Tol biopolymer transport system component